MARTAPSRAFQTRDRHRTWLTAHAVVMLLGLSGVFLANRALTPERFWAHWVALAWVALFAVHLAVFARSTLATMGGRPR